MAVSFLWWLDFPKGCWVTWSNIIPEDLVNMLVDEDSIWVCSLTHSSFAVCSGLSHLTEGTKRIKRANLFKKKFLLICLCTWVSFPDLGLELKHCFGPSATVINCREYASFPLCTSVQSYFSANEVGKQCQLVNSGYSACWHLLRSVYLLYWETGEEWNKFNQRLRSSVTMTHISRTHVCLESYKHYHRVGK